MSNNNLMGSSGTAVDTRLCSVTSQNFHVLLFIHDFNPEVSTGYRGDGTRFKESRLGDTENTGFGPDHPR